MGRDAEAADDGEVGLGRRFRRIRAGGPAGTARVRSALGLPEERMAGSRRRGRKSIEAALQRALEYNSDSDEPNESVSKHAEGVAQRLVAEVSASGQGIKEPTVKQQKKRKAKGVVEEEAPSEPSVETSSLQPSSGPQLVRRRINQKRSHVNHEENTPEKSSPEKPLGEGEEDQYRRFRQRGGLAGVANAGGRGAGLKKSGSRVELDSGSEGENEEATSAWQKDLEAREDPGTDDLRTAFSLKQLTGLDIRRLKPSSFLGGCKPEAGGKLLYDLDDKVNLHFLLSTFKAFEKVREKQQRGEEIDEVDFAQNRSFIRFLVKEARKLKLLSSKELRRGTVGQQRLEAARRSGNWSLTLDSNLAEASDEEQNQRQKASANRQIEAHGLAVASRLDVDFSSFKKPQRMLSGVFLDKAEASETEKENEVPDSENLFDQSLDQLHEQTQAVTAKLRQKLRTHVSGQKTRINISSSHGVDMEKMRDMLTAPSLSFDWGDEAGDEDEGGQKKQNEDDIGILEVDMPHAEQPAESRRNLWRQQMKRSVSFSQAKGLTKSTSTGSLGGDSTTTNAVPTSARQDVSSSGNSSSSTAAATATATDTAAATATATGAAATATGTGTAAESNSSSSSSSNNNNSSSSSSTAANSKSKNSSTTRSSSKGKDKDPEVAPKADGGSSNSRDSSSIAGSAAAGGSSTSRESTTAAGGSSSSSSSSSGSGKKNATATATATATTSTATTSMTTTTATPVAVAAELPSQVSSKSTKAADVQVQAKSVFNADTAATQDWPEGLGPTQQEPSAENYEISPTMPFKAIIDPPQGARSDDSMEISPTLPFVANVGQGARSDDAMEISPTLPFVAKVGSTQARQEDLEISPTMPFEAKVGPYIQADDQSAEAGQIDALDTKDASTNEDPVPGDKRSAEHIAPEISEETDEDEDELADIKDQDGDAEELKAEDLERIRREREWLRHKRIAVRKEAKESRQQQAKAQAQQHAQKIAEKIGTAMMNKEDRERYEAVVSGASVVKATTKQNGSSDLAEDDDMALIGGFKKGAAGRKTKKFLGAA